MGVGPIIINRVIPKPFAAKLAFPDPIKALPNNVEYP